MKKLLLLTLFSSLLFVAGCSKDDDNPTGPGGSGKTTISGKIDNWTLGTGKTINLTPDVANLSVIYGSASVAEDGSFSIEAEWPQAAAPLWAAYPDDPECDGTITVSNHDAAFMISFLVVSDGTGPVAYVDKVLENDESTGSFFFYVTKNVSITGSETCSGASSTNYSINMNQGWNLVFGYSNDQGDYMTTTEPQGTKYMMIGLGQ